MAQDTLKPLKWVFLLGLGLIGLAYLLYISGIFDLFTDKNRLLGFIQQHHTYAALIFVGLQIVQVIAAPIPGELTGFVGGMAFGVLWGIIFSTLGLTIGSWLAFILARFLGRPLVEKMVSAETFARYDYVMRHKGLLLVFLMFLIPGFPKDYLCYLLGLSHMRQRDFLLVSIPGRMLGTTLLTVEGTYFQSQHYGALAAIVGVSLVIALVAMAYRERIERWFREKDEKEN